MSRHTMYLIVAQFSTTVGTMPSSKQIVKKYVLTKKQTNLLFLTNINKLNLFSFQVFPCVFYSFDHFTSGFNRNVTPKSVK